MQWTKHGRVIEPHSQAAWVGTHAALPCQSDGPDGPRLYFSSRDHQNRSHIGYARWSPARATAAPVFSALPVLSPGDLGTFDDAGVTMSCVVMHAGRGYLYYTGWALGVSVPFYLHAGLAISDDDGREFVRHSRAPLLDRVDVDPFLTASPWVLIDEDVWRMWYVSGSEWQAAPDRPRHRYRIKYAESRDGIAWQRTGHVCIDYASDDEYAFGRPCVVKDGGRYRMWYSVRGDRYRIGYAESGDGFSWVRLDPDAGIGPSSDGWDAEMVTYPVVGRDEHGWWMLYNGNGYGRTGIGLARGTGR